jgi:hypothetical protein
VKITANHLRQLIREATEGEMQFAPLETARKAYLQDPNDETKDQLGLLLNKLVEPLMAEMGLFFEYHELTNNGDIVFTNDRNMEVRIDPRGAMGRYDVLVNPLHDAHDSFDPVKISLDSMKGVVQYIKDEFREELQRGGTYKQPPMGMVGEPEGQMELPLPRENKMRITKSQLQQVIRETIKEVTAGGVSAMDVYGDGEKDKPYAGLSPEETLAEVADDLEGIADQMVSAGEGTYAGLIQQISAAISGRAR